MNALEIAVCTVCGHENDEHKGKACWEFCDNAFEASLLFKKRMKARQKSPTWETVEAAFRAGYAMANRKCKDKFGKMVQDAK